MFVEILSIHQFLETYKILLSHNVLYVPHVFRLHVSFAVYSFYVWKLNFLSHIIRTYIFFH